MTTDHPLMGLSDSGDPHLDRVRAYAEQHGFKVTTATATQREPDYFVGLSEAGNEWSPTILSRSSTDNLDSAARYLLNTLERLGAL